MKHWCMATTSVGDGAGPGWSSQRASALGHHHHPESFPRKKRKNKKMCSVTVDLLSPVLKKICTCQSSRRSVRLVLQDDKGTAGQRLKTRTTDHSDHSTFQVKMTRPSVGAQASFGGRSECTVKTEYPSPKTTEDSDNGSSRSLECGPRPYASVRPQHGTSCSKNMNGDERNARLWAPAERAGAHTARH
jgi:hypothetical protein